MTGGISSILPRVQLGVYTQSSGSLMGTRHWLGSILRGAYMEQPVNTWLVSGLYTKEKSWTGEGGEKKNRESFNDEATAASRRPSAFQQVCNRVGTLISDGLGLQKPSSTSILKWLLSWLPSNRVRPAPASRLSLVPEFIGEYPCCSREGGVGNIWCRSAEPGETRRLSVGERTRMEGRESERKKKMTVLGH